MSQCFYCQIGCLITLKTDSFKKKYTREIVKTKLNNENEKSYKIRKKSHTSQTQFINYFFSSFKCWLVHLLNYELFHNLKIGARFILYLELISL